MKTKRKHEPYVGLRRALAGKGLTLKDVSQVLQCSEATIRMKINGYSDFFVEEICVICKRFDLPKEIFFDDFVS